MIHPDGPATRNGTSCPIPAAAGMGLVPGRAAGPSSGTGPARAAQPGPVPLVIR